MPFEIARFTALRPFLFHLTAAQNLPRIHRLRSLEPAAALIAAAQRPDLEDVRREDHTPISIGSERILLRDQGPLHPGNIALPPGWSFTDLIKLLNGYVFFWPGTDAGPITQGLSFFARYAHEDVAALRLSTAEFFKLNSGLTPHFCAFNSGAPRCNPNVPGKRSPRGSTTFLPAGAFPRSAAAVVEVAFPAAVRLPSILSLIPLADALSSKCTPDVLSPAPPA